MVGFLNSLPEWLKISCGLLIGFGGLICISLGALFEYLASSWEAKLRVFCVVLAIVLAAVLSFHYFSNHDTSDSIVYTTETGQCYHQSNCKNLHSRYKTTIAQAENDGYSACSVCSPHVWANIDPILWKSAESAFICFCLYIFLFFKISGKK